MLKFRMILLAALAILCADAASAQDRYICHLGNGERVIEVIYASPPSKVPCEVSYTKPEGVQMLWRSQHEIGYCEARAREFAERQMVWGWHCSQPLAAPVEPEAAGGDREP